MPPVEQSFDSAFCGGQLTGVAATDLNGQPALGLSIKNELYGMFGVIIPATNYRLQPGDYVTIHDSVVRWQPRHVRGVLYEFLALRIVKISKPA